MVEDEVIAEVEQAPVPKPKTGRLVAEYVDTTQQMVHILNVGNFMTGHKYEVSASEATTLRQCIGFVVTEE